MADPLSLAASVIAIATVAVQISQAIGKMRHFDELPRRVYTLKNEVSDLHAVLLQVHDALVQKTLAPENEHGSLSQILITTKGRLADLDKALDRVGKALNKSKIKTIARSAIWGREKLLFQSFQDDIRQVKATMNLMLSAVNSHDLQHIILELRQVTVLTAATEKFQESVDQAATNHLTLSSRIDQQHQALSQRLDNLQTLMSSAQLQHPSLPDQNILVAQTESSGQNIRVVASHRVPCRRWCPCACHGKRNMKLTPSGMMENVLGKMFVGYSGLPVISKPCNFRGCRDRQNATANLEYWFPSWFLSVNLKMCLAYLPQTGIEFRIATTRRIPDDSLSISFAMQGNIDGLQFLFSQKLAHPRDVSQSRGYTLMRWALYGGMHNYETVKFLISQGALVDETSYENVWDFLFRGKCNEIEKHALRCITEGGEGDWLEEQNFPLVHRIIFGMSNKLLSAELDENPNGIYLTDAQNRSALDWATARAQLEDIAILLKYGADPNNMDITGRTPVLHAVDSHSAPCLRLIVEGGGDPNPKTPKGLFRSSPLTAAGFAGMPEMLKILLEFDANPKACNPEGLTALHSVARTQNVDCAKLLLEYGADLNAMSANGVTPLTIAIMMNNHPVVQLFVDHCYDYITTARLKGTRILSIVAEHADVETIHILASSHPMKIGYDLRADSIAADLDTLQQRRDYSENLLQAFQELVAIAEAEAECRSIDSLVESGLFLSAKSSFHEDLAEALARLDSTAVSPTATTDFEDCEENLISL